MTQSPQQKSSYNQFTMSTKNQQYTPKGNRKQFRLKTLKQVSLSNVKGYKFALGRDELKQCGILGNIQKTPGPNYYRFEQPNDSVKYSFRNSSNNFFIDKSDVPPLGLYEIPGMDRYGIYSLSKYKNSGAQLISDPHLKRFQNIIQNNPGPGQYNLPGNFNDKGIHLISQYKNQIGWKFGKKSIKQWERLI